MKIELVRIKNEIIVFLLITFVITFSMGILMFWVYRHLNKDIISSFGLVQMLYPALVTVILIISHKKDNIHRTLSNFFKIYIILCILSIVILVGGVFIFPKYVSKVLNISVCIFSVILFSLIVNNKDNCFEKINMVFQKNFKKVLILCLVFIGIQFLISIINGVAYGNFIESIKKSISILGFLPFNVLLSILISFVIFFGEELGWRGYLQPRLQILFGKRFGVIVLGVIWGIWHLPLCFMFYSPKTPVYCVIFHIFYCMFIGIFFGFAYMKTGNLWSVIIIHLINNSMALTSNNLSGIVFTSKSLVLNIIICGVVFLPFIFTKEYNGENLEKILLH